MAAMMLDFVERGHELERLRAEPSLIPAYVDEMLRKEPSLHGLLRLTLVDADVGGVKIPAGSMVLVLLGSATHDEARFAEPERFAATRNSRAGLAFGHGVHTCLGAQLARLEARIAVEELACRFRGFERQPGELEWNAVILVRGPVALPLRVLSG